MAETVQPFVYRIRDAPRISEPSRCVSNSSERDSGVTLRRTIVDVLTDLVAVAIGLALLVYLAFALAHPESF